MEIVKEKCKGRNFSGGVTDSFDDISKMFSTFVATIAVKWVVLACENEYLVKCSDVIYFHGTFTKADSPKIIIKSINVK